MAKEVWIAGYPSPYGGADTELDHQISLFSLCGVQTHLVPMFGTYEPLRDSVARRGCVVHEYRDDVFEDKVVLSWCNGNFLDKLPSIMKAGQPRRIVWFNCMTWLFDKEREAHRKGWIDVFGFVSEYQRRMLQPQLEGIAPVRSFSYRPFFDLSLARWDYRAWNGSYRLGRISRDDANKYSHDTWRLFDRVRTPPSLQKKTFILGYGTNAKNRIGPPPGSLDVRLWEPGAVSPGAFYRMIDTMVHKTGGSRESYCRVLIEAYAHGVVPIVENRYAFPELVVHGETGFLADTSEEMIDTASWLAGRPDRHRRIAEAGRQHLEENLNDIARSWAGWEEVLWSERIEERPSPAVPAVLIRSPLPYLSAQCITFGRVGCLNEAIQFFLDQDYEGRKELIIVNDLPQQTLRFEHPEVRVINLPERCSTIGAKRNLAVAACRGDVIVSWDDDDGYLPGHLRACADYIAGADYARPDKCLVWIGDATIERISKSFVAQHVYTRLAFDRAGGYQDMNSGQDMALDTEFRRTVRCNWPRLTPGDITYLFHWANGEYHLSGFGRDANRKRSGYTLIGEDVARRLDSGEIPSGEIDLKPALKHDYAAIVRRFLDEQRSDSELR